MKKTLTATALVLTGGSFGGGYYLGNQQGIKQATPVSVSQVRDDAWTQSDGEASEKSVTKALEAAGFQVEREGVDLPDN